MSIIHSGFLRAILDNPDDNTPRLVYADWLEEQGDHDRADFIRVQIELAAPVLEAGRATVLRLREKELLTQHTANWQSPFRAIQKPVFTRGFVSSLKLPAHSLLYDGRRFFQQAPIERVSLGKFPDDATFCAELAECDYLSRVKALDLYGFAIGAERARALFASPHLAQLSTLHLGEGDTTPEMVTVLGTNLHQLRELHLWDFHFGELGDDGADLLASTPAFAGLTRLDLLNTGLGPRGAQAIAESPHLSRLEHLSFGFQACGYSQNRIGTDGVRALAQSPNLRGLRSLALGVTQVGSEAILELAASPYLRLQLLDLTITQLTNEGVAALAGSPVLESVTTLILSANAISDEGVSALASSTHVRNLEMLWLWNNQVGAAGVAALAASPYLGKLRRLSLGSNPIDARAVDLFLGSNRFAELDELNLSGCRALNDADKSRLREKFGDRVKW